MLVPRLRVPTSININIQHTYTQLNISNSNVYNFLLSPIDMSYRSTTLYKHMKVNKQYLYAHKTHIVVSQIRYEKNMNYIALEELVACAMQ